MLTSRLLRRVTQPGGNGLIDKDRGRGDPVMQVVTRDDGGIAGMPGSQTLGCRTIGAATGRASAVSLSSSTSSGATSCSA